ncbi:MAG: cysteine hydrolase [Alphaproteobacteria bacterium]|nr:cysteine hydrolase [Alphaproteobacteria bacterium]
MTDEMRAMLARNVAPDQAAVVVIDVQNDFCAKGGYYDKTGADISAGAAAVERLVPFIDAARSAGVRVIYARNHYDPVYISETQKARLRRVGWDIPYCRQGTWGADFYRVQPRPDEIVVTKHRFDAFYGTDLEIVLRANKVRTLIMTGVATNVCVESTLRSAFFRDFEVVVIDDCCAARTAKQHEATLDNVRQFFGMVAQADEVEAIWREAKAGPRLSAAE